MQLFTSFYTKEWEVHQDEPVYNLLNMLGSLGGLWSFFNGVSVLLFGGTIFLIFGDAHLFYMKELSLF